MNSFNHYAYGAIGDWLYRVVAGLDLDPVHPGYKHVVIAPHPGGGLTRARASLETQYGRVVSGWTLESGTLTLDVAVPANASATVRLPGARLEDLTESGRRAAGVAGVHASRQEGDAAVLEVGSGSYRFAYPYRTAVRAAP